MRIETRMMRLGHRVRRGALAGSAIAIGAFAVSAPARPASAAPLVTTPFDASIAVPGGSGSTPTGIVTAADHSTYVTGSTGAGTGCTVFSLTPSGSTATYLGRTPGGTSCALTPDMLPSASNGLALTTQNGTNVDSGRSTDGATTFTWSSTAGATALPAIAADPAPNAAATSDLYLIVDDATTGLPRIAISHDGGATYTLGSALINPADIPSGQWQGSGPGPLSGNLVARRDATGLHLYSVVETADSAADRAAQAAAKTDNLNRVYEAIGTVTLGLSPADPPSVTWDDYPVYAAPVGTGLNHGAPQTAVDSAGGVTVAFADGRHVDAKSDPTGLTWNPATPPTAIDTVATGMPAGVDADTAPSIVSAGPGLVDVAWYAATGGTATSGDPSLDPHNAWAVYLAQTSNGGTTWSALPVSATPVHQGAAAGAVQLALDQVSGAATVAYAADLAAPGLPSLFATRQCTGISAVTGTALVNDCVASQPATPVLPGSSCPGPQLRDALGDALDTSPDGHGANLASLDLLLGQLNTLDASSLVATLTLADASATLPAGVSQAWWRLSWTEGAAQRYAQAAITAGHAPAYTTGVLGADGSPGPGTAVTGAIAPGANGTITIDLPLAALGNPAAGTGLQNISAATYALYTSGGSITPQLIDRVPDGGSGADYSVLQTCAPESDLPEAPMAAILPLVGGLAGVAVAVIRRRTRRSDA